MKSSIIIIALTIFGFGNPKSAYGAEFDHSHSLWSDILSKVTAPNGDVKYALLKKELDDKAADHVFSEYLSSLEKVTKKQYDAWSEQEKMAFLINAYNAFTIKLIIANYPVKSIKDIGGFFTKPWSVEFFSLLDGTIKSLDPIEHKVLRPEFKDYRIHAAVNCASVSCPPLRRSAFTSKDLDAQLDEQMREWLADDSRNSWSGPKKQIRVSKIFDWYEEDFEQWGGGVKKVLMKYAPSDAKERIKSADDIDYLDYNWKLNESKQK